MCRLGDLRTDTFKIGNRPPKHKVEQQGQAEQSQGDRVQITSHYILQNPQRAGPAAVSTA